MPTTCPAYPDGGLVLKVRRDKDGVNFMTTTHNETYARPRLPSRAWISLP
jgi:hypothetical protein